MNFSDVLPAVGTVAGTAFGGPIGGMAGGAIGSMAAEQLSDKDESRKPNILRGVDPMSGGEWSGGLKKVGPNSIDTGRYMLEFKEGEVKLFDKQTNTWVRVWGDPHVNTSDGDKAGFTEDNLTFDLPDGTKVTLQPTEVEDGVSFLDSAAITQGMQAVTVSGLDPRDGVPFEMSNVLNNADVVDAQFADGTVLRAGNEIDDLTRPDGSEIVGTDPTQRFGENQLDGLGGTALNGFENKGILGDDGTEMDQQLQSLINMIRSGAPLTSILMAIAGRLENYAREKSETIAERADQLQQFQLKMDEPGLSRDDKKSVVDQMQSSGATEQDLKKASQELTEIMNLIKQLTDAASNIQKSYHDANQNITSNIK